MGPRWHIDSLDPKVGPEKLYSHDIYIQLYMDPKDSGHTTIIQMKTPRYLGLCFRLLWTLDVGPLFFMDPKVGRHAHTMHIYINIHTTVQDILSLFHTHHAPLLYDFVPRTHQANTHTPCYSIQIGPPLLFTVSSILPLSFGHHTLYFPYPSSTYSTHPELYLIEHYLLIQHFTHLGHHNSLFWEPAITTI